MHCVCIHSLGRSIGCLFKKNNDLDKNIVTFRVHIYTALVPDFRNVDATLPPLLNNLQHNLSSLSLEQFRALPHVTTPDGGRVPLHISVVEKVSQTRRGQNGWLALITIVFSALLTHTDKTKGM